MKQVAYYVRVAVYGALFIGLIVYGAIFKLGN